MQSNVVASSNIDGILYNDDIFIIFCSNRMVLVLACKFVYVANDSEKCMKMLCMTLLRFERELCVACVEDIVDRGGMKALVMITRVISYLCRW